MSGSVARFRGIRDRDKVIPQRRVPILPSFLFFSFARLADCVYVQGGPLRAGTRIHRVPSGYTSYKFLMRAAATVQVLGAPQDPIFTLE